MSVALNILSLVGTVAVWFAMAILTVRTWVGKEAPPGRRWDMDREDVVAGFVACCCFWPVILPVAVVRRILTRIKGDPLRLLDPRIAAVEKAEKKAKDLREQSMAMARVASTLEDDDEYKLVATEAKRLFKEAEKLDPERGWPYDNHRMKNLEWELERKKKVA